MSEEDPDPSEPQDQDPAHLDDPTASAIILSVCMFCFLALGLMLVFAGRKHARDQEEQRNKQAASISAATELAARKARREALQPERNENMLRPTSNDGIQRVEEPIMLPPKLTPSPDPEQAGAGGPGGPSTGPRNIKTPVKTASAGVGLKHARFFSMPPPVLFSASAPQPPQQVIRRKDGSPRAGDYGSPRFGPASPRQFSTAAPASPRTIPGTGSPRGSVTVTGSPRRFPLQQTSSFDASSGIMAVVQRGPIGLPGTTGSPRPSIEQRNRTASRKEEEAGGSMEANPLHHNAATMAAEEEVARLNRIAAENAAAIDASAERRAYGWHNHSPPPSGPGITEIAMAAAAAQAAAAGTSEDRFKKSHHHYQHNAPKHASSSASPHSTSASVSVDGEAGRGGDGTPSVSTSADPSSSPSHTVPVSVPRSDGTTTIVQVPLRKLIPPVRKQEAAGPPVLHSPIAGAKRLVAFGTTEEEEAEAAQAKQALQQGNIQ